MGRAGGDAGRDGAWGVAGGPMLYKAIATDYDGTLAHDGVVDTVTIDGLQRARSAGLRLLLVTGRELPDLFNTFPEVDLFDLVVGENGAVLYVAAYLNEVQAALAEVALEWTIILNKGSVMVLPARITKATGLRPALEMLRIDAAHTVGIGDAENDGDFLRICGLSVAVSNALPSVKELAQVVTDRARGAGVVEIINGLLQGDFADVPADTRP